MDEPRLRIINPKGIRAKIHDDRMRELAERSSKPSKGRIYKSKEAAEVVPGFQLSEILRKWITVWLAEKPLGFGFMGPLDWLSEKSEIHIRKVQDIVNGEFDFVSFEEADKLLTATDQDYQLHNGTIMVVPNPHWTTEQWLEWQGESECERS